MRKQVFFNEDPNHFVFERLRAGKTDITREDITSLYANMRIRTLRTFSSVSTQAHAGTPRTARTT